MSVRNCHYSLRNDSEERSSHLLCGGSLISRTSLLELVSPGRLLTYVSKEFLLDKTCVHGNGYAVDVSLHRWISVMCVTKVYNLVFVTLILKNIMFI